MRTRDVSFNVAKALKKAGYNQNPYKTELWYLEDGTSVGNEAVIDGDVDVKTCYAAPNCMDVWEWLWEKKNIKIEIYDQMTAHLPQYGNHKFNSGCDICSNIYDAIEFLAAQNQIGCDDTDKRITFFLDSKRLKSNPYCYCTYQDTEEAIKRGAKDIYTTSLANLSFDLLDKDYVIVLCKNGKYIRVFPGMQLKNGHRIRRGYNIVKLVCAGVFDDEFIEEDE